MLLSVAKTRIASTASKIQQFAPAAEKDIDSSKITATLATILIAPNATNHKLTAQLATQVSE